MASEIVATLNTLEELQSFPIKTLRGFSLQLQHFCVEKHRNDGREHGLCDGLHRMNEMELYQGTKINSSLTGLLHFGYNNIFLYLRAFSSSTIKPFIFHQSESVCRLYLWILPRPAWHIIYKLCNRLSNMNVILTASLRRIRKGHLFSIKVKEDDLLELWSDIYFRLLLLVT